MRRFIYILPLFILVGCGEESKPELKKPMNWNAQESSKFNKSLAEKEARDIQLFLEMRPDWDVRETGSGLRIWKYKEGEGESPIPGDIAKIEYKISLLDGTECYKTEEGYHEEVRVDKSDLETGVQEALKLMQVGDEAKLIVPSHIAHGLLGDLNKIPPLKSLVIDLKLTGIKK
ncbi:FKBP-type peptidyl-prolyl cis-trans isomerase [Crocinitomicaceae bacterium]|nr:FKBP-type peptidyl-prolyl cis-trans isomerase [Crocinitomicaceae bacterium]